MRSPRMRLRPLAVLSVCLVTAACQSHDANSDRDQQRSGFYGGVTGGMAAP